MSSTYWIRNARHLKGSKHKQAEVIVMLIVVNVMLHMSANSSAIKASLNWGTFSNIKNGMPSCFTNDTKMRRCRALLPSSCFCDKWGGC